MAQVQQLYRLQQLDSEISQKKRRLAEVIQLQRESEALLAAKNHARETAAEVSKWTARQTDLNLELGSVSDKAKRSEGRLYSGQLSNPKELEDLQHEVEALGRRRAVLEDEILEVMIGLEDAQAEFRSAEQALRETETAWQQSQVLLNAEQHQLATALHELLSVRQGLQARIDPGLLAEYESLRTRKNGLAVVALVNNTCMGCHVSVPANKALQVGRGEIVSCSGCDRLLCLP